MQCIFKRQEKKYIVTMEQKAVLQEQLARYMMIDRSCEYLVHNLYYDTANWDIIRESIEKPLYKEKLRLRFYDNYNPASQGFLELKKKYDGIVYKRRIAFSLGEIKKRSVREIAEGTDSQISREIRFFLNNKNVSEKIFIAYKRIAYNSSDSGFRITFDRDIRFHLDPLGNICNENGREILNKNFTIMEIKISDAIPLWLTHTLSVNKIFPVSFSKYGACFMKHLSVRKDLKEAEDAA